MMVAKEDRLGKENDWSMAKSLMMVATIKITSWAK
jgi:hypothetical protein